MSSRAAAKSGACARSRVPPPLPPERISGGRLDLGDLGTEVHEKLCGVRTCDLGGDFDDV
jgi:hypothetical protein